MTAPALARLAGLLADETRAAMCLALLDGRAWTAGELARHAGVAASTASGHLDRMVEGGLLFERRQGRHRYVELAGPRAAQLVEDLVSHLSAGDPSLQRGGLRAVTASAALARGRTCYDHLAGRLGVAVTDGLTGAGLLSQHRGFALTDAGLEWFTAALGADRDQFTGTRRPVARACLDWTERRPHLAGVAGAVLCQRFLTYGWLRRVGSGRAVLPTASGATALRDLLGIDPELIA